MNPKSRSAVLGEYAVYRNHLVRLPGVRVSAFIIFPEGNIPLNPAGGPRHVPALAFERTAGSTACVESFKADHFVLVSAATILLLSIETE